MTAARTPTRALAALALAVTLVAALTPAASSPTCGRNWSTCWLATAAAGVASRLASSERVSTCGPSRAWTSRSRTGSWPRLRTVTW